MDKTIDVQKKEYFKEINIARGIALIFVLIGHTFPAYPTDTEYTLMYFLYKFVYSFHMAVFFFLSGFVSAEKLYNGKYNLKKEILKKTKRLLIPYFVFTVISLFLKLLMSKYAKHQFALNDLWKIFLGENPNGGLWFLYTLFMISILFLVIGKICVSNKNYKSKILIWSFIAFGMYIIGEFYEFKYLDTILKYTIFYVLGIYIKYRYNIIIDKIKTINIDYIIIILLIIEILLVCTSIFIIKNKIIYLFTALIGIAFTTMIAYRITYNEKNVIYKILNELGKYSYDIYLLSYFPFNAIMVIFFEKLKLNYYVVSFLMFSIGTLSTYFVAKFLIRKIQILNKILLGNW